MVLISKCNNSHNLPSTQLIDEIEQIRQGDKMTKVEIVEG